MSTKLSKYCEGIMEAAWLAAVIVVPVFFNVYSSRIFEPDKITLLRSLALVILAAWLIKILEDKRRNFEERSSAAFALGEICDKRALKSLKKALASEEGKIVREEIQTAIEKLESLPDNP